MPFDSKIFNPNVFDRYVSRIPNTKRNELIKAGVFRVRNDYKSRLTDQVGGNYITVPIKGLIDGTPVNYDGSTNITATGTDTYSQGMVVIGRAKAWTEKDFSFDITGEDFMDNVAQQVAEYWQTIDQDTLLNILTGIFAMASGENKKFVDAHTLDISAEETNNVATETTLNNAIQKASGDNKGIFKVVILHSQVATNLDNLNLVGYLKYTDANGVTRDLGLATWNGRIMLIDDSVCDASAGKYTSYVLGTDAFTYVDCGAKVPSEMARDPYTNGGQDTLITRQRKLFAPYGISFIQTAMAGLSPTDAELKAGTSWELVKSSGGDKVINHKAIPIARIITKG